MLHALARPPGTLFCCMNWYYQCDRVERLCTHSALTQFVIPHFLLFDPIACWAWVDCGASLLPPTLAWLPLGGGVGCGRRAGWAVRAGARAGGWRVGWSSWFACWLPGAGRLWLVRLPPRVGLVWVWGLLACCPFGAVGPCLVACFCCFANLCDARHLVQDLHRC